MYLHPKVGGHLAKIRPLVKVFSIKRNAKEKLLKFQLAINNLLSVHMDYLLHDKLNVLFLCTMNCFY